MPGYAGRVIQWTKHTRLILQQTHGLFFIERMIAQGNDLDAHRQQFLGDIGSYAHAAGRVLRVGDHQIRLMRLHPARQHHRHRFTPGTADDIAEE